MADTNAEDQKMTQSGVPEVEDMAGCGPCMVNPLTKEGLLGNYSYLYLCMPSMPWQKGGVAPPKFLAKDEKLGLFLSLVMGLQHALAMVAGIATPPSLIAGDACFAWQKDEKLCEAKAYLISAAWAASGLLTIVQVFRAKLFRGFFLGTGLISVMGTSFTFLPIAREMVVGEILDNQAACATVDDPGMVGYGKFLGTAMVAAVLEIALGFLPARVHKKLFPDVVCGVTVMLIGGGLIASGIKYLGGGVFCAENDLSRAASFGGPQLCNENGAVALTFGSPQYIGLGLTVIAMSVFIQIWGSPFLKSTFIFWSLMFGVIIASLISYTAVAGDKVTCTAEPDAACLGGFAAATVGKQYSFFDSDAIDEAPDFTYFHKTNFFEYLGFAPEYLLPILIAYFVSAAETVGDIGMSCVASQIPAEGDDYNSRIQGGLLADGVNSVLACLLSAPPNTTFSQNNGVIALTRCASRAAGFGCAFWLIVFGTVGKFGAAFASIPICVVGGMVLQCFTMVFVAGMQMATTKRTRRNSFILMLSLGLGLGVAMIPQLFEGGGGFSFYAKNLKFNTGFWPEKYVCEEFNTGTDDLGNSFTYDETYVDACSNMNGACCKCYRRELRGVRTAVIMMLKTPYCIGFLAAVILNLIMPEDMDDEKADGDSELPAENGDAAEAI
ncbi:unnamed protein product [Prorocentrum cordatum]|uniref:Uncharacterized protein n=1 Tax=Prorocentrum cordatum TaxID=2364126 RepID=A0ABN9TEP5_9DINO|nr:unnamed protein product [Polarella glacialis]